MLSRRKSSDFAWFPLWSRASPPMSTSVYVAFFQARSSTWYAIVGGGGSSSPWFNSFRKKVDFPDPARPMNMMDRGSAVRRLMKGKIGILGTFKQASSRLRRIRVQRARNRP
jgi:hypothetical protein